MQISHPVPLSMGKPWLFELGFGGDVPMQSHHLLLTVTRENGLRVLQEGCHFGAILEFLPEPKHEERQPGHETGRKSQLGEHPQLHGFGEG